MNRTRRMRAAWARVAAVAALAMLTTGAETRGEAMFGSRAELELQWQWPAGRRPEAWLVAEVASVERFRGGLFGIGRSPSMPAGFPEPRRLLAAGVAGASAPASLSLVLPAAELPPGLADAPAGTPIALGLLGDGATCICIAAIPDDVAPDARLAWAESSACPPG